MSRSPRPRPIVAILLATYLLSAQVVPGQSPESPRSLLMEAAAALDDAVARYDDDGIAAAADRIRRVINLNPRYAEAHLRLGEALLWLDDYEGAAQALSEAERLRYRGVDLALLEARLAVLTGELPRARERYESVLADQPNQESARVGRAILRLADGATESVVRDLQELNRRFPENRRLLAALMRIMLDRGDTEQVRRYVDLAVTYHGESASIQLLAAEYSFQSQDFDRAEFHARNAVTLAPSLIDAWRILAQTALRDDNIDEAREHYEELLRIDPENHEAWYARGELQAQAERIEDSEQSWERALQIRPDFELARIALENTAISELAMEADLRQRLAEDYRQRGAELQERFLNRQAERHFRRGLQLNPFDPVLRASIADLYLQRGWEARYLAELEVIQERELTSDLDGALSQQELEDRLDIYRARLANSPAAEWDVDQFTVSRPRTTLFVVSRTTGPATLVGADRHIGTYTAGLLQGSQRLEIVDSTTADDPVSGLVRDARNAGADLLAVMDIELRDRSASVRLQLIDADSTRVRTDRTFRRSGNGRIDSLTRAITDEIEDHVELRGSVVRRRFEEVLISVGRVDGVSTDDAIRFVSVPGGEDLGSGTVREMDDLVTVVAYEPSERDNLTVGDHAVVTAEEAQEETDETDETEEPPAPAARTSPLRERVQQLFQVR